MSAQLIKVTQQDDGLRLDRWFNIYYDLSFVEVQKKCRKGEMRLDGKRVKGKERVQEGMIVRVPPLNTVIKSHFDPKAYNEVDAKLIRDMVIYKDDGIISLNKRPGLAVQGGSSTQKHIDALTRYLHRDSQDRPRLVHRLDKDTSGVLLLARTRQTATDLMHAFKTDKPRKVYWAVVVGEPEMNSGTVEVPLMKRSFNGTEKVVPDDRGKDAVTEFEIMERLGGVLTLVALYPRTGRTHQLRAHMAYLGTPILGDGKYGGRDSFVSNEPHTKKMHLHARSISLPDGISGVEKGTTVTADLPSHIKETFKMFGVTIQLHFDNAFQDLN